MHIRRAAVVLVLAGTLVLAGCGTAPWNQPRFSATPHAAPDPGAHAHPGTPRKSAAPEHAVVGDLASGRARHILQAGDLRMTATYWSPLAPGSWSAAADKPITLSLTAVSTTNAALPVYLSSATLDTTVQRRDGRTAQLAPQVDRTTTAPGYAVQAPYSYGQSFIIPAVAADATGVTLVFSYAVLEETTPTSNRYSKQSAVDTVTVPIAAR